MPSSTSTARSWPAAARRDETTPIYVEVAPYDADQFVFSWSVGLILGERYIVTGREISSGAVGRSIDSALRRGATEIRIEARAALAKKGG